jgi:tetratricopeptide (TPR) repeat protein
LEKLRKLLNVFRQVISGIAKEPGTPGLEESIGSYTEEYLEEKTPTELKDHYYSFPGIDSRDMATRALLRIAIIGVFEEVIESSDPEKEAAQIRDGGAMIETLFQELQRDFKPKDLSNFILVRVGDFIRKTTQPQAAEVYYKEALSRPDQSHMFAAIFGLADVYSKGTSAQKSEAIKLLKRVSDDSDDSGEREEALYLTASIHADNDAYDAAIATAKEYLETDGFRRYAVPCRMLLAASHDKAGRADDALTAYQQVWISSMGTIRFSSPAMKRWMEILWKRGGNHQR